MTQEEFFRRYTYNPSTDRLGSGSFGKVYRAYDNVDDTYVALKIAPVEAPGSSLRLQREVELVRQLPPHPNVARYDACYTFTDATGDYDVAVLRYYPDGSLLELERSGSLTYAQRYDLMYQLLKGLKFLHSQGIIHRDLKPANVLIARRPDGSFVPKITDFGISMQLEGENDTVKAAATVSYASPEQLHGKQPTSNADLWSYGVMAYEIFTGRQPFTAGNLDPNSIMGRAEIASRITSGNLPTDISYIAEPWDRVVAACLVVDPERRTSDEDALLDIIANYVHVMPPQPPGPPQPPVTPPGGPSDKSDRSDSSDIQVKKTKKTNWWLIILVIIAVALVAFIVIKISLDNNQRPQKPAEQIIAPVIETVQPEDPDYIDTAQWYEEPAHGLPDSSQYVEGVIEEVVADDSTAYDSVDMDSSWYN